jgi:hypothetical protein
MVKNPGQADMEIITKRFRCRTGARPTVGSENRKRSLFGSVPKSVSCVPKRTYMSLPNGQDTAMPKSMTPGTARRRQGRARSADFPNAVEGQIAEICRDLSVQAKRMRQLQEQADELCMVIRQWAGGLEADSRRGSPSRGGRR